MTSVGAILKAERERQGRETAEIAEELCITQRYLRAIEQDDLKSLPGSFFYKSFVKQYAAILGLDEKVLQPGVDALVAIAEPEAEPELIHNPSATAEAVREWPLAHARYRSDRARWESALHSQRQNLDVGRGIRCGAVDLFGILRVVDQAAIGIAHRRATFRSTIRPAGRDSRRVDWNIEFAWSDRRNHVNRRERSEPHCAESFGDRSDMGFDYRRWQAPVFGRAAAQPDQDARRVGRGEDEGRQRGRN